ncbi:conserved Plasmodium protein, unknown function [Plasmodium malariae]|uniref:RSE1/DDB1/CPSF1 C-terminal domain-containing protein n=1 Tax=Plasmodium malariae TaxID=5858 RepID=A0A1D3RIC6_PLAMA|nr:conserved Plasmodium protein, unknown function [Plasmodium malariae]SCN44929.1 conserved Plasmodium protein, unknown function [Plasmodium malariae]
MIDIRIEEVRNSSEIDHCECCNLLNEKSIEFVIIKNKDLYIYKFDKKKKINYLFYETKLNAAVIKLVTLKNVFQNKKKKNIFSGILLIYKNLHFIIYKYKKSLNSLVVVLRHTFIKEDKFQSLFYSLPHAVNYTHNYEKRKYNRNGIQGAGVKKKKRTKRGSSGGGSSSSSSSGNGSIHNCSKRQKLVPTSYKLVSLKKKKKKIKILNLLTNSNISRSNTSNFTSDWKNNRAHKKKSSSHDDKCYNDEHMFHLNFNQNSNNKSRRERRSFHFLDSFYSLKFKKRKKYKKCSANFCNFHISFSYDFKTVYTFFYTTREKKQISIEKCSNEKGRKHADIVGGIDINTNYFSTDLFLENVTTVSLEQIYKNFIFVKKIFFYADSAHILLQNDAVNIGHTKLEDLGLKLLIVKIEKDKLDVVNFIRDFPNDILDILRVQNILICVCYDYVYILNLNNYKKIIYFFNKSCYMNNIFQLIKNNCLFYDYSYLNTTFKKFYLYYKKKKIFILSKNCIIEGNLSKNFNDLINLIKWKKTHIFKYTLTRSAIFSLHKNVYFLCCYDGICGRADITVLRKQNNRKVKYVKGNKRNDLILLNRRKRKLATVLLNSSKKKKKWKKDFCPDRPNLTCTSNDKKYKCSENSEGENSLKTDKIEVEKNALCKKEIPPFIRQKRNEKKCKKDEKFRKGKKQRKYRKVRKVRKFRRNNNFLFDLLNYLNKNVNVNEYTRELNNNKYNLLFKKYKNKIKMLENNFSRINAQGIIEYSSPLFILKKKKKSKKKIEMNVDKENANGRGVGSENGRGNYGSTADLLSQEEGKENENRTGKGNKYQMKNGKIILMDKIRVKGLLTDLCKLNEEGNSLAKSIYFALVGCKQHSTIEKVFFQIPLVHKLDLLFEEAVTITNVCFAERKKRKKEGKKKKKKKEKALFQYVLITLEKKMNGEKGKNQIKYSTENTNKLNAVITIHEEDKPVQKNCKNRECILFCIYNISFLKRKKAWEYYAIYENSKMKRCFLLRQFSKNMWMYRSDIGVVNHDVVISNNFFDDALNDVNYSDGYSDTGEEQQDGRKEQEGEAADEEVGEEGTTEGTASKLAIERGNCSCDNFLTNAMGAHMKGEDIYGKVIYIFTKEEEEVVIEDGVDTEYETFLEEDSQLTGKETVEECLQFFKNFHFLFFSIRDIEMYLRMVYVPHIVMHEEDKYEEKKMHLATHMKKFTSFLNELKDRHPFVYNEIKTVEHILICRLLDFFLSEKKEQKTTQMRMMKKKSSLNLEECCIALLNFNHILIQVCKNEINLLLYENTYILIKKINLQNVVLSCKLVNRYLILLQENCTCSVFIFDSDAIAKIVEKILKLNSICNLCILHCLIHDYKGQHLNIFHFINFLKCHVLKNYYSQYYDNVHEKGYISTLFKIKNMTMFHNFLKKYDHVNVDNILTPYTHINNIRCISVLKKKADSYLCFLNNEYNSFQIFNLDQTQTIFKSNSLLCVPKFVYNCVKKKGTIKGEINKTEREKINFLNIYNKEKIVNIFFFKLGMDYILIIFLTGRPILIYKTFVPITDFKKLKFKIIIHKYVQPLISNIYFLKEDNSVKLNSSTVVVTTSTDKHELNNGCYVLLDGQNFINCSGENRGKNRGKNREIMKGRNKLGKEKSIVKNCIIVYPHINMENITIHDVSDGNKEGAHGEKITRLMKQYHTNFPLLLLSNYKGKLFIHSVDNEKLKGGRIIGSNDWNYRYTSMNCDIANYANGNSINCSNRDDGTTNVLRRWYKKLEGRNDCETNMDYVKGIIQIDNNEFISFSNKCFHIFSINDKECNYVDVKRYNHSSSSGQPNYCDEVELKTEVTNVISEACSFSFQCTYSNVNFVQVRNNLLFLKRNKLINLSINDDIISKTFVTHPYIYKFCVSKYEYILKKARKRVRKGEKRAIHKGGKCVDQLDKNADKNVDKNADKNADKNVDKNADKNVDKNVDKDVVREMAAELDKKWGDGVNNGNLENTRAICRNRRTLHTAQECRVTYGKIVCAVVRIKYDEYDCLKKLLKKRLNIQKEELKNNTIYANEEVQCVPNVYLNDCINSQYTHKVKSFLSGQAEDTNTLDDEKAIRKNNKLIQSVKTFAKYYKLLLFHENSKNVYGYYIFEHSEEIQCISFGCLDDREFIYVGTGLNINERIETQGNIYIFDFSKIFVRYNESERGQYLHKHDVGSEILSSTNHEGNRNIEMVGSSTNNDIIKVDRSKAVASTLLESEHNFEVSNEKGGNVLGDTANGGSEADNNEKVGSTPDGNVNSLTDGGEKRGKLVLHMKKTYNSCVTQIYPFYFYSNIGNSSINMNSSGNMSSSINMSSSANMSRSTSNSNMNYKNGGRTEQGEILTVEDKYCKDNNKNIVNWISGKNRHNNMMSTCYCNILHCINSKLYIHEVNENDFTKGAFIDNNFFISDIKIVRNFIIIADLYKGIYINMYNYEQQYDSRSIISISKTFYSYNLNILCCHYIIFNSYISIIAMDVYNNFFIFSYKNCQDIDHLYIFNYFNFNRRIIKFINLLHTNQKSNSVMSISNDGSIHLFHPVNKKIFLFFKEIYKISKKYIFPNLALNVYADMKPDFFIQSILLNLHKRSDSFLVKNVLFDDLLRQIPFYSCEVLYELFCKKANLLIHITIGELLNELHSLSEK